MIGVDPITETKRIGILGSMVHHSQDFGEARSPRESDSWDSGSTRRQGRIYLHVNFLGGNCIRKYTSPIGVFSISK